MECQREMAFKKDQYSFKSDMNKAEKQIGLLF